MQVDDTALIPLTTRRRVISHAVVDSADAAWANQWGWHPKHGYAVRREKIDGRMVTISLHRELLDMPYDDQREGDHINRNKLDNRRSNLRIIPREGRPGNQNRGAHRGASSAHRGVYWNKKLGKWAAQVRVNGAPRHLGVFTDEHAAAEAARQARARLLPYAVD